MKISRVWNVLNVVLIKNYLLLDKFNQLRPLCANVPTPRVFKINEYSTSTSRVHKYITYNLNCDMHVQYSLRVLIKSTRVQVPEYLPNTGAL